MIKKIINNLVTKNYFKFFYLAYVKNLKIEGSYTFKREKYDRRAIIASVIINKKNYK